MKEAVADLIARRGGALYDPVSEIVITDGDGSAILNAMFVLTDPGDEVILTDPTYAGMLQRVRLVGAVPKLVPLRGEASGWRLDVEALERSVSDRTRVLFLMNPAIPSGWVASADKWTTITAICRERGIVLLYWSLWEAMVFDGRPLVVPSGLDGMRDLTVTAGAVSLEQRMIGWRVGWMVARADLAPSLAMVHVYNGVVTSGFGQMGAAAALRIGDDDVEQRSSSGNDATGARPPSATACRSSPPTAGGRPYSTPRLHPRRSELSRRLLEHKVAATPMTHAWGGPFATRYLRLVFSNESVERLALLGDRLRAALR